MIDYKWGDYMSSETQLDMGYNSWNKVDSIPEMSYETKNNNKELDKLITQFMEYDANIICKECETKEQSKLLAGKLRSYMNCNAFKNSKYKDHIRVVKRRLNVYLQKVD